MQKEKYYLQSRRIDGRKNKEIRNIKFRLNIIPSCQTSLFFEMGVNKLIVGIFGPKYKINKEKGKNENDVCIFRTQVFSLKFYENNKNNYQFLTIINRIIEETLLTTLIENSFYNIIIRKLQNDGNFLNPILIALSLSFLMSGLPIKTTLGGCTSGILNFDCYTDLTTHEWFLFNTKTFLVLQSDCENEIILLDNKNCWNTYFFETSIQHALNGSVQIQLLKFSLCRYSFLPIL
nr:exosome complex component RRP41-like protein [Cryptomonas curvata]|mmetsp:Transcript_36295/g.75874  ORF Transcript_36295/g.75874 Transcript_36295/m.75874 type:complete len:234 (-) Transcript_36295:906-1607(-)